MSTTDTGQGGNGRSVDLRPAIPAPARIGQATAVEQSRAVAEVEAAVIVAQRMPRNVANAIAEMRESCKRKELADRAFYRYPKGGQVVSGPTVVLARELARIWGNIQWGLREMRRDGDASEMLAFAWDVQTNARCDDIVINPHRQYTGGRRELTELRDINDNNTSVGSRRVREAIFSVLPSWFVEEAKDLCAKTIADGGGVPLPQRIANAIEVFGNLGVTVPQMEAKIGQPSAKWTDQDVAHLRVIRQSLLRGEISKEEEFPSATGRVTAEEITGKTASPEAKPQEQGTQAPAASQQAAQPATAPPAERPVTSGHKANIERQRKRLGFEDHETEEWLSVLSVLAGLQFLEKVTDLSDEQATWVLEVLGPCADRPALMARTIELREHGTRGASPEAGNQPEQTTLDEASA